MTTKLEPGEKVAGRYRIVRQLGEGGMGTIWEVHNENVERSFAIKVLSARLARDPIGVQRFLEEAKAVGRIRHPGVVEVVDAGKLEKHHGSLPYMVMEKLEGEPLDRVLRAGPMSIAEALRVVRDAALAVGAAHEAGIIHRDIKPGNLFMHRPPELPAEAPDIVKVLDFGISKSKHAKDLGLTGTGVLLGTPSYMSPEQLIGNIAEAPSDVWALGVVLYACLCCKLPFSATQDGALINQIREEPHTPLPLDVPPGVSRILDACLAKRPADRPASAKELAAALGTELAAMTARSLPPPSFSAPAVVTPITRSRKVAAPLAAGGIGLVIVLVAFAVLGKREPKHEEPAASSAFPDPPPSESAPAPPASVVDLGTVDDMAPPSSAANSTRPPRAPRKSWRIHPPAPSPSPTPPAPAPAPAAAPAPSPAVDPLRKPGF